MGGRVFSRRAIAALGVGSAAAAAASGEGQAPVDRRALVRRHSPVVRSIDPRAPLSVGNGELAMTVDVTGLQSIPDAYQVPLNVLAQWAWHSNRPHPDHPQELRLTPVETHGRTVYYPLDPDGQQVTYAFHRAIRTGSTWRGSPCNVWTDRARSSLWTPEKSGKLSSGWISGRGW